MGVYGRKAQGVNLFPRADAHVGWVHVRTLDFQLKLPVARTLFLFEKHSRTMIGHDLSRGGAGSSGILRRPVL